MLVASRTSFDTRLPMTNSLAYFNCVANFYQNIIFFAILSIAH